jgi:hypothetical protein
MAGWSSPRAKQVPAAYRQSWLTALRAGYAFSPPRNILMCERNPQRLLATAHQERDHLAERLCQGALVHIACHICIVRVFVS